MGAQKIISCCRLLHSDEKKSALVGIRDFLADDASPSASEYIANDSVKSVEVEVPPLAISSE